LHCISLLFVNIIVAAWALLICFLDADILLESADLGKEKYTSLSCSSWLCYASVLSVPHNQYHVRSYGMFFIPISFSYPCCTINRGGFEMMQANRHKDWGAMWVPSSTPPQCSAAAAAAESGGHS